MFERRIRRSVPSALIALVALTTAVYLLTPYPPPVQARDLTGATGAPPLPPGGTGLWAGAARADITPSAELLATGQVFMAGYAGRPGPATAAHAQLWARALALSDGATTVVLLALDLEGMSQPQYERMRQAAARAAGLAPEAVLISATHTHSAPDVHLGRVWGGVPRSYRTFLRRQAARAAGDAVAALRPARLRLAAVPAAGQGAVPAAGLARNRRGWPETDAQLGVVQVVAAGGGAIATLVNFAAHPTVVGRNGTLLTPDFAAPLVSHLEAASGGMALFVNGAQGDASPVTPAAEDDFAAAAAYGRALAERALGALDGGGVPPADATGPLRLVQAPVYVPVANTGMAAAATLGLIEGTVRWTARRPWIETHTACLSLGRAGQIVTIPGEAVAHVAAAIRELQPPAGPRLLFGLTGDSLGYLVDGSQWMTGRNHNYEESVSLGPGAAPALLASARAVLGPCGR